jgi:GNAT superfamily N-acetyltransferase
VSGKQRKEGFLIERLQDSHDRTKFSCGIHELDTYFKTQAGQDARRKVAAPFVLIDGATGTVAGFYTLSMKSVMLVDLPAEKQRKLPRYPEVPVVLLGRMGVDVKYQGKGLGEVLLFDALKRSYETSRDIAAFAVIVDAKHGADKFYLKYGFLPFPEQKKRLFLPMKTIEKLLEK